MNWLKRFWWVLALFGVAVGIWIRRLRREADRARGLQAQKEIERTALQEHEDAGNKSRRARYDLNKSLEQSRQQWAARKAEMEQEIEHDDQKMADAWNRAFGRDSGKRRAEDSGE